MGTKAWSSVLKSFYPEVESRFGFLVDEFGFAGPRRQDHIIRSVSYMTTGFGYEVSLEPREGKILTSAWTAYEERYLTAELDLLVEAAGLAPRQRVSLGAQSVFGLRKSIASQAHWVHLIHPRLVESTSGLELIRTAARWAGSGSVLQEDSDRPLGGGDG